MNDIELKEFKKRPENKWDKPGYEVVSCIGMINSQLAYHWDDYTRDAKKYYEENIAGTYSESRYFQEYIDKLGMDKVIELFQGQINDIDHIEQNVFTDDEGLSYNSIVWNH